MTINKKAIDRFSKAHKKYFYVASDYEKKLDKESKKDLMTKLIKLESLSSVSIEHK